MSKHNLTLGTQAMQAACQGETARTQIEAAVNAWQHRQMTEWLVKPVGHHASKCEHTHRTICAIQIIRTQEPVMSINELADAAGIPRTTLRDRLSGRSVITVTNVCSIAIALCVPMSEIFALSEMGEIR